MTSEFFSKASSTFAEYDITNDQITALKSYLDSTSTSAETAKHLTQHPSASLTPVELKQRLGGLWTLLNHTAVALPSAQPVIISVLQTIRTLPQAQEPKGEGEEYIDLDDGFYWRELTDWASNWADAFNSHAARFLLEQHASAQEKERRRTAWTNACEYTARLAATGDAALSCYGAGLDRATRAVAEALEVDAGEREPGSLEAAARVFVHAGSELWRRCRQGQKGGMLTGASGLWDGGDGFSEARWRSWKERWAALAGRQEFSEHARAVAREALDAMEKAEASGS